MFLKMFWMKICCSIIDPFILVSILPSRSTKKYAKSDYMTTGDKASFHPRKTGGA